MAQARRAFPQAPSPFIDLSTGINPIAYPLPPLDEAAWTRLPEPEAVARLQAVAAAAYGVDDPDMVVAAPGTQVLIDLLPRLWPQRRVDILGPTYGEHEAAWRRAGARVEVVEHAAALEAAPAAVVVNPNNPDGRRQSRDMLVPLADRLGAQQGLLVVDEAFADLEPPGLSMAGHLPCAGLVVLRSFGKTYGLAGLRLGFALAAPALAAEIRAALGPWAVSGPAIAIGCRALADAGWRQAAAARLAQEGAVLDGLLEDAGMQVAGGTLLFRLGEGAAAPDIHARLGAAGLLVRRFSAQPNWLRFGLPGTPEAWQRLRAALAA